MPTHFPAGRRAGVLPGPRTAPWPSLFSLQAPRAPQAPQVHNHTLQCVHTPSQAIPQAGAPCTPCCFGTPRRRPNRGSPPPGPRTAWGQGGGGGRGGEEKTAGGCIHNIARIHMLHAYIILDSALAGVPGGVPGGRAEAALLPCGGGSMRAGWASDSASGCPPLAGGRAGWGGFLCVRARAPARAGR